MKNKNKIWYKDFFAVIFGVYLALLLWITVISRDTIEDNVFRFKPLHSIASIGNELASGSVTGNLFGNIFLFIPFGFLSSYVFKIKTMRYAGCAGLCFSLLVETCQALFSKGYFEIDDLINNTVGTLIGYYSLHLLFFIIRIVKRRKWNGCNREKTSGTGLHE